MSYLLFKSLHIVAVIIWMGGMVLSSAAMLWLSTGNRPRVERETEIVAALKRWDSRVTSPAMGLAWVFGIVIAVQGGLVQPALAACQVGIGYRPVGATRKPVGELSPLAGRSWPRAARLLDVFRGFDTRGPIRDRFSGRSQAVLTYRWLGSFGRKIVRRPSNGM